MKPSYYLGRFLQLAALIVMPSAIFAGEFLHSEKIALTLFLGSGFIFLIGWILAKN